MTKKTKNPQSRPRKTCRNLDEEFKIWSNFLFRCRKHTDEKLTPLLPEQFIVEYRTNLKKFEKMRMAVRRLEYVLKAQIPSPSNEEVFEPIDLISRKTTEYFHLMKDHFGKLMLLVIIFGLTIHLLKRQDSHWIF